MTPFPSRSARRRGLATAVLVAVTAPMTALAAGLTMTSEHLTTTATCALVSYPATGTYRTDSFVASNSTSQNNGTVKLLTIQSQSGANDRVYVRFDLSTCLFAPPAGAIVRSASLRMYVSGTLSSQCRTYDVFRNTVAWGETSVTWANQPAGTASNLPASAGRTSSADVGAPTTCTHHTSGAYVTWDVAADVQAFLTGTVNDGWVLRDDVEDAATGQHNKFIAREQGTLTQAPQLLITYTEV